jgi:cobalt-zinc-cadmium efflux system membrane fusion protein
MRQLNFFIIIFTTLLLLNCKNHSKISPEKSETAEASNSVVLSAESQQTFGLKIESAQLTILQEKIICPGRVEFDQQRLAHLTSRVAGRVEQVYAFLGDRVNANQLLATIYSQDYLTAQAELIQAHERLILAQGHRDSAELKIAQPIFESAKGKLLVIGVAEADVQELVQTHLPRTFLEVRAPLLGSIIEANEIWGYFVEVGTYLFHIADLSTVWIIIDINEKDLEKVKPGYEAMAEVAAYPSEKFGGQLTRVFDVVDEKSRTVKGRVELRNHDRKLKPQMFATVQISSKYVSQVLALPASAVQMEGDSHFVFVALNDSSFQRRNVSLGKQIDGWLVITDGLQLGEKVVSEGAFDLKAEMAKSTFGEE